MEVYEGVEAQPHAFLISRLDSERSVARSDCVSPEEVARGANWIRGWVVPRASLNAVRIGPLTFADS
jgi:hypothetical protein